MHEVLINRLGGLSLPRKSVVRLNGRPDMTLDVRLTGRPDMTLDVNRGRKTTTQQQLLFIRIDMALMNIPVTSVN